MGITEGVAQYIAGTKFEDLPQNVVGLTKQLVLDEIGCAMGALSVDQARILVEYAKDIGGKLLGGPDYGQLLTGRKIDPAVVKGPVC